MDRNIASGGYLIIEILCCVTVVMVEQRVTVMPVHQQDHLLQHIQIVLQGQHIIDHIIVGKGDG
jgi:hypothetical protein